MLLWHNSNQSLCLFIRWTYRKMVASFFDIFLKIKNPTGLKNVSGWYKVLYIKYLRILSVS